MYVQFTLMREVQTIAPALTMGLCGLSVGEKIKVWISNVHKINVNKLDNQQPGKINYISLFFEKSL